MPFLGDEYRNWKAQLLAGQVVDGAAQAVGDMLGRIHSSTADNAELAARFATDDNFYAIRLEPYLVETARVHPALAGALLATVERTASTRRVLVHGDVSPKNILIGPSGPVLLDAECAWFGDPAFDVAFCLNHFLLKAAHLPQHADAMIASFGAFKRAYFAHVQWGPPGELEQRTAQLLPGLTLARVDGKSPVEYLTDPQREAVRKLATQFIQHPPASLDVLAAGWAWEFMS